MQLHAVSITLTVYLNSCPQMAMSPCSTKNSQEDSPSMEDFADDAPGPSTRLRETLVVVTPPEPCPKPHLLSDGTIHRDIWRTGVDGQDLASTYVLCPLTMALSQISE